MQNERKQTLRTGLLTVAALACAAMVVLVVRRASAQVPDPVLTISETASNVFQIRVSNAVSFANYELYRRTMLDDPNFPWTAPIVGGSGQSNFVVTNLTKQHEFFKAGIGSDWDGDGIPNTQDGQPTNSSVGALRITIDKPVSGLDIR